MIDFIKYEDKLNQMNVMNLYNKSLPSKRLQDLLNNADYYIAKLVRICHSKGIVDKMDYIDTNIAIIMVINHIEYNNLYSDICHLIVLNLMKEFKTTIDSIC